jgi:basic amino acid/polyamine antiporter, APA family
MSSLFRKKTIEQIKLESEQRKGSDAQLSKTLTVKDLIAFGIAAIVGAGIFSTIGQASYDGGPGVIFLFLFTALACGFAAFAYAEFASIAPVSGSAYTYSYIAFGELVAWIIGWSLIMEYAVGNITVAISWSDYFTGLLASGGIELPTWMTMDYLTASRGFKEVSAHLAGGTALSSLSAGLQEAYQAWMTAPVLFGFHFIADLPALLIIILITYLVYRGMKESRNASNAMVIVKLAIVLLVIAVGAFYVDTTNWNPFAPNGLSGILKGVSAVFFAYIGFDAISTTAEECKNPQRDLPRGMMWAIIICTVLYIAIALVLTGMVSYDKLNVGDPLAFVFKELNIQWLSGIIAVSAIIAMASVLLVFQMGQPRIWMSMSRDGLLPKSFAKIHPKYQTPSFATIVTGFVVAVPALFLNLTTVTDLCSIGTLFAFVLVCAGVLKLQVSPVKHNGSFKTPYINAKFTLPLILIAVLYGKYHYDAEGMQHFLLNKEVVKPASEVIPNLSDEKINYLKGVLQTEHLESSLNDLTQSQYLTLLEETGIKKSEFMEYGWSNFSHKIPTWVFILTCIALCVLAYNHNLSLIPCLGLVCCLYMMSELGLNNWIGFGIWLLVGLLIYFSYGRKKSMLNLA